MTEVTFRVCRHAAHYGYSHPARGHDLHQWDAKQAFGEPRPDGVPRDAEKHSGYIDSDGNAHTIFVKTAPLSDGECPMCKHKVKS